MKRKREVAPKLNLSEKYYSAFNGSCRQVPLDGNGQMDEWPYNLTEAKECDKKGKHPHMGSIRPTRAMKRRAANSKKAMRFVEG